MRLRYLILTALIVAFTISCSVSFAQKNAKEVSSKKSAVSLLFSQDDVLKFTLTGKLKKLFDDRGDSGSYHPFLLQYMREDSTKAFIDISIKTRGHFRRDAANCKMPPLLLSFSKDAKAKNYLFDKQTKLKLVVPCQGDEYVIKEWLVYKLYNIITEKSLKARLALVDFEDFSGTKLETRYCILLEDEKKMADRNNSFVWKKKFMPMRNTNSEEFKKMAVFQYLIGNTDWSVPYLQNIILITKDSTKAPFAVPYDFDHAGIVDAPYAAPAPELEITNDRIRLYRGFCENDKNNFTKTFDFFNQVKNDIYNVYDSCTLLKPGYLKFINKYLDDFYRIINNDKKIEKEFMAPCRTDVRIELKGLKD